MKYAQIKKWNKRGRKLSSQNKKKLSSMVFTDMFDKNYPAINRGDK